MYLLNELLFLSPLAAYVALRIRSLIARRPLKDLFTVFFILLALGYPAVERLAQRPIRGLERSLALAGYCTLPLFLYLVLAVVLTDAAVGLLRLTRILSREAVRRPAVRLSRLGIVLLAPVLVVGFGIWNHHHLRVSAYSIEIPRRSSTVESLRIAFAADFHLGVLTDPDFMERFVAKVNALEPDIVLIGGDVAEGHRTASMERFAAQFRNLRSKYGVYGVPGNHDGYGESRAEFFNHAGIRMLHDEVVKIDDAFYVVGRQDVGRRESRASVGELLREAPEDLPVILLSHRPVDLENVSRTRVDVQLSGHTHNGQLFPVNLITAHEYELSWGHMVKRRLHVFVTSGVQLWGPPVRTAGVSEIMLIDVAFRR